MPALAQTELAARLTELSERAVSGTGIEIVEVEVRGSGSARLVRVYIDKPAGVTHADCELVSERLDVLLDEQDIVSEGSYTLEVSSPGVDRKLSKPRDFERIVGKKIKVALREPMNGQRRLEGKLCSFAQDTLEMEIAPDQVARIPLAQVQKANLKFEW